MKKNNMKKIAIVLATLMSIGTASASDFTDVAEVVHASPRTHQVQETTQECYSEQVREQVSSGESSSGITGGQILGGIAGGIIGHQVGRGNGQTAATAAGAILGTVVGGNVGSKSYNSGPQYQTRTVQRCNPVTSYRDVTDGWDVTYQYNNQVGKTVTRNKPGSTIRVGVTAQ